MASTDPLVGNDLTVGYHEDTMVLKEVSVSIREGSFTAIIGPNACGKSTLLRTLSRLLRPHAGTVLIDGTAIEGIRARDLAVRMGLLPQSPSVPDGISVFDLVARGRYPHQSLLAQWTAADEQAVTEAMERTQVIDIADRSVDTLSGGQRQRAWIAMALAQDTGLLLLDEPTTFLDIAHQIEVLRLLDELRGDGRTVVAVLHDLNQAARFATDVIAMREGEVVAAGPPAELFTEQVVEHVYGLPNRVIADPDTGSPVILPR